jgi:hypothetical protein
VLMVDSYVISMQCIIGLRQDCYKTFCDRKLLSKRDVSCSNKRGMGFLVVGDFIGPPEIHNPILLPTNRPLRPSELIISTQGNI